MSIIRALVIAVALTASVSIAIGAVESSEAVSTIGKSIADFTLQDSTGTKRSLSEWGDKRAVVIFVFGTECPLARLYGPRCQEMAAEYASSGVQFIGINANRQDSLEEIAEYGRQHKIEFPLLQDVGNHLADELGAERTPEVFLLDNQQVIRYRGLIDDQYGIGYARAAKTDNPLANALEDVLAGRPVASPVVPAIGCIIGRVPAQEATGDITFSRQIAPLLNKHCVSCHRAGEVAPFELTSYEKAVGWSGTIDEVVREERMPPWHANPAHGKFQNDARLTDDEKQLIATWVKNGSPEGDPAELPTPPKFTEGWLMGKPDVVYKMPRSFDVPAKGVVEYQYFVVEEDLKEDLWVRGSEMRPGNRAVVHHLILFYIPPNERPRGLDAVSKGIATFAPGMPPVVWPEGLALRIPAGSKLVFQAHYTPNGTAQRDLSEAGLLLADPKSVKQEVTIAPGMTADFKIPPGDKDYRVKTSRRLAQDSWLYTLTPHMHVRGKSFRYTAHYPDGQEEILLDVPHYDFNWQNVYTLAEPKRLPGGTRVEMEASYDNSAENKSNPDPSQTVTWGDQTWEEMMIGSMAISSVEQDLTLGKPRVSAIDNDPVRKRVEFKYKPTSPVKNVYLAGSFNGWKPTGQAMEGPDGEGGYKISVDLAPGDYEYRFVIDGATWHSDPGNPVHAGMFANSVLKVE